MSVALETVVRWWGIVFRLIFISFIAIANYLWLDPKSIGDVPLASLTLRDILGNILVAGVAIYCLNWIFQVPEDKERYLDWAKFGTWVAAIIGLVILISNR